MSLDLLLVNAPSSQGAYQKLSKFAAIEPPVWAALIAEHCIQQGWEVAILDAEAEGLSDHETAHRIAQAHPMLAAFSIYGHHPSASTQCMPAASAVAEMVSLHERGIRTLAFGTHPSALPFMTLFQHFDFVCEGEGPHTISALLVMLRNGMDLDRIPAHLRAPGLWWDGKLSVQHAPPAPLISNLDGVLPRQALQLLDMTRYRPLFWHQWTAKYPVTGGYASVQTSLGCPFKCEFCCINAPFTTSGAAPQLRKWSPQNVAMQINELVEKYGITNIKIPDEMFCLDRKHVSEICGHLLRLRLGDRLNMWAYARIDTVRDDNMLALMRRAGFRWLGIGIESASKHVRDGVEKGRFGNDEIFEAVTRVHGHGLHIGANYIFGLPDDTHESMKETLDLACALNTAHANFYCAMAYPGSALHKLAKEKKWRLPEDPNGPGWIGYAQHSYFSLPLRTEALSVEEVLDFRDEAFLHYHQRPAFLNLLRQEFGEHAVATMQEITALGKPQRAHRDPDPIMGTVPLEDPF